MKNINIIIITLALIACKGEPKAEENELKKETNTVILTDAQYKNIGIQLSKMQSKTLSSILKVNGSIDVPPQNMVSISIPLGGYLKTTKLLPGMHVNKGEIIAVIEDQQYIQLQQDYLTTKSKLQFAQLDYERQKELNQSKASSDKVFQQATADYKLYEITLNALAEKLRLVGIDINKISATNISRSINVYAPINGFVTKVNVNIGKYVSPTDVLFELVNPSDIHLALKVYEKDLDKIFIGQKLMAYTNGSPDKKHPCEILLIGKDLTNERSTDVHCHFNDYDKTLIPGTYMNAEIEVKNNTATTINEEAIVRFEGKQYVFAATEKNSFEMIEVTVGITQQGFIEIVNGEKLTSREIVSKGAYSLLMSLKNKGDD